MNTRNVYHPPIDLTAVTSISNEGIAHVGNLMHSVDFDAPEGTEVFAALEGIVLTVKDDSDCGGDDQSFEAHGNYIEILHAHDEVSEYEHIRFHSARVKVGDLVHAGDVIAEVGNTGWSACPHLHFMVYEKGSDYETREIRWTDNSVV